MSADGTRLFAVNTPNQTLSVFDLTVATSPQLIAEIPVGLEPVSVNPANDDIAWVVNQLSNSISIVSVSKGIVLAHHLRQNRADGRGLRGGVGLRFGVTD